MSPNPITPEQQYIPLTRREALASGNKFYNTGISCKRNHICNRYSYSGQCVECVPITRAKHRSTGKHKATDRAYYQKNKAKIQHNQKLNRYGISQQEYDDLLKSQNFKCDICKEDLTTEIRNNIQIDHCHNTGKVRGILCLKCNLGLGYFLDNVNILNNAILYLNKSK